jgi:hypothetical protein
LTRADKSAWDKRGRWKMTSVKNETPDYWNRGTLEY